MFNAVEDDDHDDLVGHYAGLAQKLLVAFLDALYGSF
jgi:hypothetical protein